MGSNVINHSFASFLKSSDKALLQILMWTYFSTRRTPYATAIKILVLQVGKTEHTHSQSTHTPAFYHHHALRTLTESSFKGAHFTWSAKYCHKPSLYHPPP